MNFFDYHIITFLNRWSQQWPAFDRVVVFINDCDLLKGGVIISMLWWAWFHGGADQRRRNREITVITFLGCHLSLLAARVLAHSTAFRIRPMLSEELHFVPPISIPPASNWDTWNSFPSDHAALFFSLALGVFLVTRAAGGVLMLYFATIIVFCRVYTGVHYPTDILAGLLLGACVILLLNLGPIRRFIADPVLKWQEAHPSSFYAVAFFLSFQVATLFYDLRMILWHLGCSV